MNVQNTTATWPRNAAHRAAVQAMLDGGWNLDRTRGEWSDPLTGVVGRLQFDGRGNVWVQPPCTLSIRRGPFGAPMLPARIVICSVEEV